MKIRQLMTTNPSTCSVADHLATAAMKMWEEDCGIMPVMLDGELQGMITDRDIAMALAMKGASATDVRVGEVITGHVFACAADEEVSGALHTMAEHKVRRLPVLDDGKLVGLVSMNDIVLAAASTPGKQKKPSFAGIIETLQAICAHRKVPVSA